LEASEDPTEKLAARGSDGVVEGFWCPEGAIEPQPRVLTLGIAILKWRPDGAPE